MNSDEAFKAGQQYAQQNPYAQKATEQQIPNADLRNAFNNGMG